MKKRERLKARIDANNKKIKALQDANTELHIQEIQVCDKDCWYKEEYEERILSKRPRKTEKVLVGRRYWNEFFQDGDAPKGVGVIIERSQVVRINGVWYL